MVWKKLVMFRVGPNKKDDYGKSADENLAKWLNDKYGEENWKKDQIQSIINF